MVLLIGCAAVIFSWGAQVTAAELGLESSPASPPIAAPRESAPYPELIPLTQPAPPPPSPGSSALPDTKEELEPVVKETSTKRDSTLLEPHPDPERRAQEEMLQSMGFSHENARFALSIFSYNQEQAANWLLQDEDPSGDMDAARVNMQGAPYLDIEPVMAGVQGGVSCDSMLMDQGSFGRHGRGGQPQANSSRPGDVEDRISMSHSQVYDLQTQPSALRDAGEQLGSPGEQQMGQGVEGPPQPLQATSAHAEGADLGQPLCTAANEGAPPPAKRRRVRRGLAELQKLFAWLQVLLILSPLRDGRCLAGKVSTQLCNTLWSYWGPGLFLYEFLKQQTIPIRCCKHRTTSCTKSFGITLPAILIQGKEGL